MSPISFTGVFLNWRGSYSHQRFCSIPRSLEKHGHTECCMWHMTISSHHSHLGGTWQAERRRSVEFTMFFFFAFFYRRQRDLQLEDDAIGSKGR